MADMRAVRILNDARRYLADLAATEDDVMIRFDLFSAEAVIDLVLTLHK